MKNLLLILLLHCSFSSILAMEAATKTTRRAALSPQDFQELQNAQKKEAERLLEMALGTATATDKDKAAIAEIQAIIKEKKYLETYLATNSSLVNQAIEIYKKALEKRQMSVRSEELIAMALYNQPGTNAEDEAVIEVRNAVRKRVAHYSQNINVREALNTIRKQEEHKVELLHYAAAGKTSQVERFIAAGADLNTRDIDGNTAVALAVKNRQPTVLRLLLEAGADPNTINSKGSSALGLALTMQDDNMISLLKEAQARVQDAQTLAEQKELFRAANFGNIVRIKELLKKFSANITDEKGNGLIALAVESYRDYTVFLLIDEYRARINIVNLAGETPLDMLSRFDNPRLADFLKKKGALTAAQCKIRDQLFLKVEEGDENSLKALLSEHLNDPELYARLVNATNDQSDTMLARAAHKGWEQIVIYLVNTCKAEKNVLNDFGMTALDLAYNAGHKTIATFLAKNGGLSHRIDVQQLRETVPAEQPASAGNNSNAPYNALAIAERLEASRKQQDQALLTYAAQGNIQELAEIINRGIADSPRDKNGQSALHLAASEGHYEAVKLLLNAGARYNALDDLGHSVLDVVKPGADSTRALLVSAGALSSEDLHKKNQLFRLAKEGKTALLKAMFPTPFMHSKDGAGNSLLAVAAMHAQHDTVQMLVDLGLPVNTYNNQNQTVFDLGQKFELIAPYLESRGAVSFEQLQLRVELLKLAQEGDFDTFKYKISVLEKSGMLARFLSVQDENGETYLMKAVRAGKMPFVRYLVEELKVDISQRNHKLESAYEVARDVKNPEMDAYILKHMKTGGSVIKSRSATTTKPLSRSSSDNALTRSVRRAATLIRGEAPCTSRASGDGKYESPKAPSTVRPFHELPTDTQNWLLNSLTESATDAQELIDRGIDVYKVKDGKGNSVIALSIIKGNVHLCSSLLKKQIDLNIINTEGFSPLDLAMRAGNPDLIASLKRRNALTAAEMHMRRKACELATEGKTAELKKVLTADIPVDITDSDGYSLVQLAAMGNHTDALRYLIGERDAKVNVINKLNRTALDLASNLETRTYLQSQNGVTYEHIAKIPLLLKYVKSGEKKQFVDLLATVSTETLGRNLCNVKDQKNHTPLSEAARYGWIDLAKILVEIHQVDLNPVINEKTPLDLAKKNGHEEVVIFLQKAKALSFAELPDAVKESSLPVRLTEKAKPDSKDAAGTGSSAKKEKIAIGTTRNELAKRLIAQPGGNQASIISPNSHQIVQSPSFVLQKNATHELLASYAIIGQTDDLVERLKSTNTSADLLIDDSTTLLAIAVKNNQLTTVKALVEQCGAQVNMLTNDAQSPLDLAGPYIDITRYLMTKRAMYYGKILADFYSLVSTPKIQKDAVEKFISMVRLFPAARKNKADILKKASDGGNQEIVQLLNEKYLND